MQYKNRMYVVLFPNLALIGSHLTPEQFAKHYSTGSTRYYRGKVIFAEINPEFRDPYFDIDGVFKDMQPHEDGRPKATKFICSYRVLEHLDFDMILKLYVASPEGYCIGIDPAKHEAPHEKGIIRVYAEIAPMRMLVLSDYNFIEYSDYITQPNNHKGAPKLFYTQIDLSFDEFLSDFEKNPFLHSPILNIHPSALRDSYHEILRHVNKHTKGLCLDSSLDMISYKQIKHGFMFASQGKNKFFPFPEIEEIEKDNYKFWRSM
jgi:hypothetical protein